MNEWKRKKRMESNKDLIENTNKINEKLRSETKKKIKYKRGKCFENQG